VATALVQLLLGFALLYFGAEWFVKGAAGLGRRLGVRPLVIGLTVVAYGTSMPELVVSTVAAISGSGIIALTNAIGSNIANLGLILGITAMLSPIPAESRLVRREAPILAIVTFALPLLLLDGVVSRWDAALLLLGAGVFTYVTARFGLEDVGTAALVEEDAEMAGAPRAVRTRTLSGLTGIGLVLLLGGGQLFVAGAVAFATSIGMSERVIGLTIVAVGTSMPELAASVVAALRGHSDIALGNVIGSNIFNILFVIGGAGMVRPLVEPVENLRFDLSVLGAVTLFALLLLVLRRRVSRISGAILTLGYLVFLGLLAGGA
jgi:cation:H+ antiporter